MSANSSPIFALTPNNGASGVILTAGNNNYDGTNANAALIYTAGVNGSFLSKIICKATGTNVATVIRIFLNNNSTVSTAANNSFFLEFTLAATAAASNAAVQPYEFILRKVLAPSTRIYAILATTVAAGYAISAEGGDY